MKLLAFFQSLFGIKKSASTKPPVSHVPPESDHPYLLEGKLSWSVWPVEFDSVHEMLEREVDYANQRALQVVLYTHAGWCPGSSIFKQLREHPEVIGAFDKIHMVEVDYSAAGHLAELGMESHSIPTFFAVDDEGDYTGQNVNGGAWGEDVPETIGPVMKKWVASL